MELFLFKNGLIHHRSVAASLGGAEDAALDLSLEGWQLLMDAIDRTATRLLEQPDPEKDVQLRAGLYQKYKVPKLFVNIGGAQINIGNYNSQQRLHPGINHLRPTAHAPRSMADYFANHDIPIIHLLKIEELALKNNLAIDPIPLPKPGKSAVYFNVIVPFGVWVVSIVFMMAGILVMIKGKKPMQKPKRSF